MVKGIKGDYMRFKANLLCEWKNCRASFSLAIMFFLFTVVCPVGVSALDCGKFTFPKCDGADLQYAGGFDPKTGFGGFGGGKCKATRTPVIFIHGNGDRATNWDSPVVGTIKNFSAPSASVYREFKSHGYNDCELFGITYLSPEERNSPKQNYHRPEKYEIIIKFIEAVKAYTGKSQVDIVAHSLGVSMTLASLSYYDDLTQGKASWSSVRRFINIAGGIRGIDACKSEGFANPLVTTCGSENISNKYIFGFYPDSGIMMGYNHWMGDKGHLSLRRAPEYHPGVYFYTIHAGLQDEIHCSQLQHQETCSEGALFNKNRNVKAQLNIGTGTTAQKIKFDFKNWNHDARLGGDFDGVGHFKAKNNAGQIIFRMLNSDCAGLDCKGSYTGSPVIAD
jgi:pimeloyl-ACP methyl ester carboxylesterase